MFEDLFVNKVIYDVLFLYVNLISVIIPLWIIYQHPPKEAKYRLWGFSMWRLFDVMVRDNDLWLDLIGGLGPGE